MQRAALLLGVLGLLLATSDLSAQDKPNFSGTWTVVADAGAAGGGGGGGGRGGRGGGRGGLGMAPTIMQDAAALTITRMQGDTEVKTVYKLDGSESVNTATMGRGGQQVQQTSKAAWEGSKLVITTSYSMNENPVQTTMALSLNAEGQLVVETTAPGRGGGDPTTTTQRYTKGG
jgi:hypothetical protein